MDWLLLRFVSSRRHHTSDRHPKSIRGTTKVFFPIHRKDFEAIPLRLRIQWAATFVVSLNRETPMRYVRQARE